MRTPRPEDLVEAVVESGVTDERIIEAFRTVRRADFVPSRLRGMAYEDRPLPIPHDQVTTQPSLSARMIDALGLTPESSVLEVGTGYGFQTALMCSLASRVTSVEWWPDLAEKARANLARCGIGNVTVLVGDGTLGVPEAAPFDAILVSAAFPEVPLPLIDQLADGGRLVQPIGPGGDEVVTLFRKRGHHLERFRAVIPAHFVRLVGAGGYQMGDGGTG